MTPEQVCDAVFGEYTRNTPLPRQLYGIVSPWQWVFPHKPHDFWVDPVNVPIVYGWAVHQPWV